MSSRSLYGERVLSAPGRSLSEIGSRQESESASRDGVERKGADGSQSLQDEYVSILFLFHQEKKIYLLLYRITSVLIKLVASKIKLEKVYDFTLYNESS